MLETMRTDILIIGSGGAGLFAALHAKKANPDLDITIAVKGLLGKSGCTRMVQGGYNVALAAEDSIERHFMDTIVGGKWLPHQDLAWKLVNGAVKTIHELENEYGCYFDRNPDGTLHQKAFAGQSFDRTVHKGDLTGIEIINRLAEQVWKLELNKLEEHRAVAFVPAKDGSGISGVLLINMRGGTFRFVQAKMVLLGAGGGPTMYRYHTPSGDKACDGMAMGLRAGLALRDMEMVQFHPTGILAGNDTRMTGTILEEGLRGSGGYLLNGTRERFMTNYDPAGERATRDIVSRAMYEEVRAGRGTPNGGIYIRMVHLGPEKVAKQFKGMVKRCADCGFDLAGGDVEVLPTAHYMMGGIEFETDCATAMAGLYVAGEDSGGVHGANRLGGNGVANSTVFGGVAGESMAAAVGKGADWREPDAEVLEREVARCLKPFAGKPGDLNQIRETLVDLMWDKAGIVRDEKMLKECIAELEELGQRHTETGLADSTRAFNLTWHDWMNLESQILVSKAIAQAALARKDSRGAHYRSDFPETGKLETTRSITVQLKDDGKLKIGSRPVKFTIVKPGESLIDDEAGASPEVAPPPKAAE
jgi:fumarate reductase flavoprotein subunit